MSTGSKASGRRREQDRAHRRAQLEDAAQIAIQEARRVLQTENIMKPGLIKNAIERGKTCIDIFLFALGSGVMLRRYTYRTIEGTFEEIKDPITVVRIYNSDLYKPNMAIFMQRK